MARLIYSARALADLERITDFLLAGDGDGGGTAAALETVALVEEAVAILRRHPLIGRPEAGGLRELAISRGRSGHVALHSFEPVHDAVPLLAIRHQREAGCLDEGDLAAG